MQFDYPDWSSIHRPHWASLIKKHIDLNEPLRMIEVGCFEGRSTVWFADYLQHHPMSRLICIDSWTGGEEFKRTKQPFDMKVVFDNFWKNISEHPQSEKIFTQRGQSDFHLSMQLYKGFGTYNLIYLDGSHTQRDTMVDLTLALLLIKKGGVIIIDDYLNNMATNNPKLRPQTAVDFVVDSFDSEVVFSVTPEKQAVIIRK